MDASPTLGGLDELRFDNRFTRELPADPSTARHPRQVQGACYSRVTPFEVREPKLLAHWPEVAELVGLSPEAIGSQEFAETFAGNRVLSDMDPFAMCYGGHQFGHWAGQLGDGRAINLGQVVNAAGESWTLQLKGAGPTPYSRSADGFAVLRSSIREFLCSEAMFHLGVPTTRALSLVTTGEAIPRDMFYDGRVREEPGAVVCRVARSFTRFGNFQIFAARGETEVLRTLLDHTIRYDFPHLVGASDGPLSVEVYARWFEEVCSRTSALILHWMRVGFVHGVMNTDNLSILGETIDYGPYGWLEGYEPNWTPNTTDAGQHRYAFGNQAPIAHWNLIQLANAIAPLMGKDLDPLRAPLESFPAAYQDSWRQMMLSKLGLELGQPSDDDALIEDLSKILQSVETDMTIFFRNLAKVALADETDSASADELLAPLMEAYYLPAALTSEVREKTVAWLRSYGTRVRAQGLSDEARGERMNRVNPLYVLRNYQAQLAIDAAEGGDGQRIRDLQEVLRHPYDERAGKEEFAAKRPEWARERAGCSMLSCSS